MPPRPRAALAAPLCSPALAPCLLLQRSGGTFEGGGWDGPAHARAGGRSPWEAARAWWASLAAAQVADRARLTELSWLSFAEVCGGSHRPCAPSGGPHCRAGSPALVAPSLAPLLCPTRQQAADLRGFALAYLRDAVYIRKSWLELRPFRRRVGRDRAGLQGIQGRGGPACSAWESCARC